METAPTYAGYRARIRLVRICMALLSMQGDMAAARDIVAAAHRKPARW
ncbi:hypothetical protein FHW83_003300 [Duganella sp. SG902]|nr:hypothetical protein [Duganella sp. SG902]NVM77482.1 hypothetical protein [Duganella sp. SG902]